MCFSRFFLIGQNRSQTDTNVFNVGWFLNSGDKYFLYLIKILRFITATVCSNYSFGDQCQKTCNCDGYEGCDDVTGTCAQSCLSGWKGPHCDKISQNRGKTASFAYNKTYLHVM